jgi:hypothetical protein
MALTAAAARVRAVSRQDGEVRARADGREPVGSRRWRGCRYCLVAENLALNLDSRGFETRQLAGHVLKGWKESPGHRANLLQADATEIGVAVARAPDRSPKFISVQLFGRPEALKVTFRIENRSSATVHYRLGTDAQDLPPRTTVTHTDCWMAPLAFDGVPAGPGQFAPRDGDRYLLTSAAKDRLKIDVLRK